MGRRVRAWRGEVGFWAEHFVESGVDADNVEPAVVVGFGEGGLGLEASVGEFDFGAGAEGLEEGVGDAGVGAFLGGTDVDFGDAEHLADSGVEGIADGIGAGADADDEGDGGGDGEGAEDGAQGAGEPLAEWRVLGRWGRACVDLPNGWVLGI